MYTWLWRKLPNPVWLKVAILVIAFALISVALFAWVFPAVAPFMPFNSNTVE